MSREQGSKGARCGETVKQARALVSSNFFAELTAVEGSSTLLVSSLPLIYSSICTARHAREGRVVHHESQAATVAAHGAVDSSL